MWVTPYYDRISQGLISKTTYWDKIGYSPSVPTSQSDIWPYTGTATMYTPPSAGIQMQVLSSSNSDTGAGLGARTVTIGYLDHTFTAYDETLTMNGTTAVLTTSHDIYRINSFRVVTSGNSYAAVGNITLQVAGGGTVYGYILAGFTRSRNSWYTVPAGYTLYIKHFSMGFSSPSDTKQDYARISFRATYNDHSNVVTTSAGIFYPYGEAMTFGNSVAIQCDVPIRIPAQVDTKCSVVSASTTGVASSVCRGYLIQS